MKKLILIALVLSLGVLVAARVRTGSLSGDVLGTTGAGVNSTGTNQLLGYLPPKGAVASIDINIGTAFAATTNNFINVFGVYTIYTNSVSSTLTNYFLIDHNVGTLVSGHCAITNGFIICSSNASTAVYANYEQNGAAASTVGAARVIVNYIQF
jgi:hypothetical protein